MALVSALGGILIGQIGNVIISLTTKRLEHRSELRRLIVNTGADEWKELVEQARRQRGRTYVMPMGSYILFNAMIADLILEGKDMKEEDVREILKKNDRITKIIEEFSESEEVEAKKEAV